MIENTGLRAMRPGAPTFAPRHRNRLFVSVPPSAPPAIRIFSLRSALRERRTFHVVAGDRHSSRDHRRDAILFVERNFRIAAALFSLDAPTASA